MKTREVHLKSRPVGMPTEADFELVERSLPEPTEGQILVRNEWISVDPYMRSRMREGESYVEPFALEEPMEGGCVGKVIESQRDDFAESDYVLADKGWRDCWCSDGEGVVKIDSNAAPVQQYLGVLGLTGMTAFVGLMRIGQLQQGERVFVSAASGAVGSIACQIAKINKCRVVGSAARRRRFNG